MLTTLEYRNSIYENSCMKVSAVNMHLWHLTLNKTDITNTKAMEIDENAIVHSGAI